MSCNAAKAIQEIIRREYERRLRGLESMMVNSMRLARRQAGRMTSRVLSKWLR
jgi:hypothetical protein